MHPTIDLERNERFMALHRLVKPYTITSIERQYGLYQTVKYLIENEIDGDIVECGVWKGGSVMLAELAFQEHEEARTYWLYDTFAGMTLHGEHDHAVAGVGPEHFEGDMLAVSVEQVVENLAAVCSHASAAARCLLMKGDVRDTLGPARIKPQKIALLHLDTDWYDSTKAELEELYPRVVPGGVVIADDYGHWLGQGKAVDEYFTTTTHHPLLHRLDYSGVMWIKG